MVNGVCVHVCLITRLVAKTTQLPVFIVVMDAYNAFTCVCSFRYYIYIVKYW